MRLQLWKHGEIDRSTLYIRHCIQNHKIYVIQKKLCDLLFFALVKDPQQTQTPTRLSQNITASP